MTTPATARLTALLEHLEATVDAAQLGAIDERHRAALHWEPVDRLPLVLSYPLPTDSRWPLWPQREIYAEPAKMLYNELVHAFDTSIAHHADVGSDLAWTVRANFGTVVMASLFGAIVEQVEDNPPWARPHEEHPLSLDAILAVDPTDFTRGWCPRVVERYAWYRAALQPYPRLAAALRLVLPDLQGPFDTLEMLIGGEAFTALYDEPEKASAALRAIAAAQVGFARHLQTWIADGPVGCAHQHATAIRGSILLRDDTAIMVAPSVYRELIAPHDAFIFAQLDGGGIHSCGNVGRHVPEYLAVPGLRCFDFGQAELNDVDRLYALARTAQIGLTRVWASAEELTTGAIARRFPTGVSLRHRAASAADARRLMDAYRRATA